jgi:hypothetical protein
MPVCLSPLRTTCKATLRHRVWTPQLFASWQPQRLYIQPDAALSLLQSVCYPTASKCCVIVMINYTQLINRGSEFNINSCSLQTQRLSLAVLMVCSISSDQYSTENLTQTLKFCQPLKAEAFSPTWLQYVLSWGTQFKYQKRTFYSETVNSFTRSLQRFVGNTP